MNALWGILNILKNKYRVIIIKVPERCKKRTTDQNDAKFERKFFEQRRERMA